MPPLPLVPVSQSPQNNQTPKFLYVTVDEKCEPNSQEQQIKTSKMHTRWLRFLSVIELVFAVALIAVVITTATLVPIVAQERLLLVGNLCYGLSLVAPAVLGLLAARRRKNIFTLACMGAAIFEIGFSCGSFALQFMNMQMPIKAGTRESQLVETQFGVGMAISCASLLLSIAQAAFCCREACPRRCRTYDHMQSENSSYSSVGYVTRTVHKQHTTFSYPPPSSPVRSTSTSTNTTTIPTPPSRSKSSPPPSYFDCYPTQPHLEPLVPSAPSTAPRRPAPPPPRPSAPPRPTDY